MATASESWFRSLFKTPRAHELDKTLEVLAFEVASLMSKLIHLWQNLRDSYISKLMEEIRNSQGVRKLVSEDDDLITRLICSEIIDNMMHVAKSVVRLSKRCADPNLKNFEPLFNDLIRTGADPFLWRLSARQMDKKIKKMEKYISINCTLYQEMELLNDLEQTVKRLKTHVPEPANVAEFEKKMTWKKQEVKALKEVSLWCKPYAFTITLLAKSLFTIFHRINDVFGILNPPASKPAASRVDDDSFRKYASGPLNWISSRSQHFLSGPLKRERVSGVLKHSRRIFHVPASPFLRGRRSQPQAQTRTEVGVLNPNSKLLTCHPGTLGASALSLHYANLILLMEKLAASPRLIGNDARADLYNMLPGSIKSVLRERLRPYAKSLICDTVLAQEWMDAMGAILDWLAPLAHNMITWQSERSFEQHSFLPRTNVLLVQTLYFASQERTEAVICELLVGLNYVWRIGKEANAKIAFKECVGTDTFQEYLRLRS